MPLTRFKLTAIGDGGISTAKLADGAVTTAKVADSAVNSAKIGVDVIAAEDLAANSVTVSEITDGAVTSAKLDTGAVTSAKLDTNIDIAGTLDVTGATTLDAGLTVDTTTFVVDATNNHVGFGTATPSSPIDATLAAGGDWVARFQNTTSATPYNVQIYDAPSAASGYPLLQVTNSAGSQQYFRIDSGTGKISAGKMTHFVASGSTGWTTFSNGSNTKISYTSEVLDAAGTYDASNARFTATTPGWYRFEQHMYARLQGSQGDNSNYWWGGFLKNGSAVALNGVTQNITGYQNDGDYDNFSIATAYFNLSTGDYVEAYARSAGPSNGEIYRAHSLFIGQQLIV